MDEYSRMYVPDARRESVVVLDDAGNEVLRLGKTVAAVPEGKGAAIAGAGIEQADRRRWTVVLLKRGQAMPAVG
jgi:hypothetical protein